MNGKARNEEQMVMFCLSGQNYGVSIDSVYEVIRMEKITKIPETPDFVEGVINLRGKSIAVVDLSKRLSFVKAEITDSSRIIIMDIGSTKAGFIVDEVLEVIHVPQESIQPAPRLANSIDSEFLKGVALLDKEMVIVLDISNLLQQFETESLIAAQEKAEVE